MCLLPLGIVEAFQEPRSGPIYTLWAWWMTPRSLCLLTHVRVARTEEISSIRHMDWIMATRTHWVSSEGWQFYGTPPRSSCTVFEHTLPMCPSWWRYVANKNYSFSFAWPPKFLTTSSHLQGLKRPCIHPMSTTLIVDNPEIRTWISPDGAKKWRDVPNIPVTLM